MITSINIARDPAPGDLAAQDQLALIIARFNRLPASAYLWRLIALLSLCGFFEIYEIALTSTLSPGLIRAGVFHADAKGLFGLTDQASFAAATFLGLFIGTSSFATVADRLGRRDAAVGVVAEVTRDEFETSSISATTVAGSIPAPLRPTTNTRHCLTLIPAPPHTLTVTINTWLCGCLKDPTLRSWKSRGQS